MVAAAEPPPPGHGLTVELRLQRLSDRDPSVELRFRTLSGREREILGLLANGWSNRRIAEECRVSFFTVRSHVQSVLVKLGVHSKLEAVALAAQHGVLAAAGGSAVWDRHSA